MTDEWSPPVEIRELRKVVDVVLAHVEEFNGPVIEIPHDLFWAMHAPAMCTIEGDPAGGSGDLKLPELTLGSLSDAWDFLHSGGEPISYSAVWLAQILTAIGHTAT